MPWQLGPTMRTPLSATARCELGLELAALRAGLPEACRQHHGEGDAGLAAIADGLGDAGCRHGDEGELARLGHRGDVGIAGKPMQLPILGIDGVDAARIAGILERLDRLPADAGEVGRCADDGDALRMEKSLEAQDVTSHATDLQPDNKSRSRASIFLARAAADDIVVGHFGLGQACRDCKLAAYEP